MDCKHLILISVLIALTNAVQISFEGYKVYKVIPSTQQEVDILKDVQKSGLGEFWDVNISVKFASRIMVSKENQETFVTQLKAAGLDVNETIVDLQKTISDQLRTAAERSDFRTENFHDMTWDRYHTLDEIYNWLDVLNTSYGNVVNTVTWGRSNENRELKGIVLDYNPGRQNKVVGVIEGTLHAREWIVPATVTWIIKEFLVSTNAEIRALARNIEWHILPIANPDGYLYTFTTHRMWRKNRNTRYNTTCAHVNANDDLSNGVDLNRNFGFEWMTIGASDDPCREDFAGSTAFSEPEARAIRDYTARLHNNQGDKVVYYLAFHSFTQLVVVPFSHITDLNQVLQVSNYADMFEIGVRAAARLSQRFGTRYRVGVAAEILYPMSGTSFDWVKNEFDTPVCYLVELRDLGDYGFLLPPEQIIPNNLEIMDFLLEMDKHTQRLGYYTRAAASSIVYSLTLLALGVAFTLLNN